MTCDWYGCGVLVVNAGFYGDECSLLIGGVLLLVDWMDWLNWAF